MKKFPDRFYARLFSMVAVIVLLSIAAPLPQVGAASQVLFDSIPAVLPGSFPSQGYEANSTHELGDNVSFTLPAGNNRLTTVSVNLTNWACENDFALVDGVWTKQRGETDACITTPGTSFSHPITLNIYAVDHSGNNPAPGALLATKTATFTIPFRPSYDSERCSEWSPITYSPFGGKWFDPVTQGCVTGKATTIDFDFSAEQVVLPSEIIYGVAYNTSHYGATPLQVVGPYDSLNLSFATVPPTIGTDVEAGTVFVSGNYALDYCDGGAGGLNVFRRAAGCWDSYIPVIRISSFVDDQLPVASTIALSKSKLSFSDTFQVTLSATLNDAVTGNSDIASAEYQLSGESTWKPMVAVDGAFDSATENVQALFTVASLGLAEGGDFQLCVRGTDSEDNTSAETCTAISVHYMTYLSSVSH